jgi:hypothetical protein
LSLGQAFLNLLAAMDWLKSLAVLLRAIRLTVSFGGIFFLPMLVQCILDLASHVRPYAAALAALS